MIDPDFLKILGCPLEPERPPLELRGSYLICTKCGHGYEIRDGVPDLLPEHAIPPDKVKELTS